MGVRPSSYAFLLIVAASRAISWKLVTALSRDVELAPFLAVGDGAAVRVLTFLLAQGLVAALRKGGWA